MLITIKRKFPGVNIHGFSPPEIHHFTKINRMPIEAVLSRLRDAGLGSLPGGGAEILADRVRKEITRGKVLTDDWLTVMRVWHELGGRSTATMKGSNIWFGRPGFATTMSSPTLKSRIEPLPSR